MLKTKKGPENEKGKKDNEVKIKSFKSTTYNKRWDTIKAQ